MRNVSGLKDWSKIFICGICIGAADIVPGISGGTIALILGIYEPFIASINSIQIKYRQIAWGFLSAVGAGIAAALFSFSVFIDKILNQPDYRTCLYSGFIGLIAASVWIIAKKIRLWQWSFILAFSIGAVAAYFLTALAVPGQADGDRFSLPLPLDRLEATTNSLTNYDPQTQTLHDVPSNALAGMIAKKTIDPETIVVRQSDGQSGSAHKFAVLNRTGFIDLRLILCGIVAITAMLLPGISGSYLLVILGVYPLVIGAVADMAVSLRNFHIDSNSFFILFNIGAGIAIGGLVFARAVDRVLKQYHDLTITALLGFMLGALPSLWPFQTYQYYLAPLNISRGAQLQAVAPILPEVYTWLFAASILCAAASFILAAGIDKMVNDRKGREASNHKQELRLRHFFYPLNPK